MASVNEIAFTISAKMQKFNRAMQEGAQAVDRLEREISDIGKQKQAVDNLIKLRQKVGESAKAALEAKNRVKQLSQAMAQTANPTARMRSELVRAQTAAARATETFNRERNALREMNAAMNATNTSTQRLYAQQSRLNAQTAQLRARQQAHTATIRQQSAAYQQLVARQRAAAASRAAISQRASAMQGTGGDLMAGGTVMAGAAAAYAGAVSVPIKLAIDYESAFADVKKVVDFKPGTVEAQTMSDAIVDLSKRVPIATDKLAAMVATAAQSGIAKDKLISFTEQSAKMAVAFDVTAEESAQLMNNWRNAMGLSLEETYALADSVNHLSNNTNTTAATLSNFLDRAGGLGKMAGLTAQQTAAMGSAIMSTGVAPEVAATGFKNFTLALQKGAASTKGQQLAWSKLGMSATDMAKRMQTDAQGAIMDVLKALQKLPAEERAATMSQLFGTESLAAITPLVGQLDNYQKTLGLVADKTKYAGSMQAEYDARSKTTQNSMELLKNRVTAIGIELGAALLPSLNKLMTAIVPLIEKISAWVSENQELIVSIVEYGAIVMAVVGVIGTILTMIGTVMMAAGAIYALVAVISFVGAATVGIWLVAVAAILAAGWWIYDNWEAVCAALKATWDDIVYGLSTSWKWLSGVASAVWSAIGSAASTVANAIAAYYQWLFGVYATIWNGIKTAAVTAFTTVWTTAQTIGNNIISFFQGLSLADTGRALIMTLVDGIKSVGSTVYNAIKGVWDQAAALLPHSDADEGPFSHLTASGRAIPETMAKGIMQSGGAMASAFTAAATGLTSEASISSMIRPTAGSATAGAISVNFAPTITVNSDSKDAYAQVTSALNTARGSLLNELEALQRNQRRLSYA